MLYNRHNYLNKNIEFLVSNEIIEYDMQSAGFNILKYYKLVSDDKLNFLESLGKKERHVQIGLYQRADKVLARQLNDKFIETRKWFFEQNELIDEDILSIKKDAVITFKRCLVTELDNIKFIEKNIYTSYYYLNKLEFYYNNNVIHVKGINDDLLKLHSEYMLDFLHMFFRMNETIKVKKIIEYLKEFSHYYKNRHLEIGYYRELNKQSLFKLNDSLFNSPLGIRDIGDVGEINIDYNYLNYLIPLIGILI